MTMELDKKAVEAAAEKICCPNGCTRKARHDPCIAYTVMDVAEATLRAYEVAKWRPIEEAPRQLGDADIEREFILQLYCPREEYTFRVQTGFWNDVLKCWEPCDASCGGKIKPTHFQPLPPPPDDKEG